jgi:hypothetical protein
MGFNMRPPLLKFLRIAVTVTCLVVCALLIAWWVRGYWKFDVLLAPIGSTRMLTIITCRGHISFGVPPLKYYINKGYSPSRQRTSGPVGPRSLTAGNPSKLGIHWSSKPRGEVIFPFWMLVLPIGISGVLLLKGEKWQFSLRSMLFAITLVAVVLGLLSILY